MPHDVAPPFRADHVGSFLRPPRLLEAARGVKAGAMGPDQFRAMQDECVTEIVRFQETLGLRSITDGEYRRRSWSAGFIDAIPGFGYREGSLGSFKTGAGSIVAVAQNPYAKERLRRVRGIATDEFRFLKSVVRQGVPKVTLPSPTVMHFFLGPRAVNEAAYPDLEPYFEDLVTIYRQEIAELAALGCIYLQLDDTALACLCDPTVREQVKQRGEDPDTLLETYARLINSAIQGRPANMTVAMHLCRGNLKGAWMAEGGYALIADVLFNSIQVDAYFLEYDSPRAGDFRPLSSVPGHKTVVLGLLSTKTPVLEERSLVEGRIAEAARYCPLQQLCLSPQCGFSSAAGGGQVLTESDTAAKVRLMQTIVSSVWGTA